MSVKCKQFNNELTTSVEQNHDNMAEIETVSTGRGERDAKNDRTGIKSKPMEMGQGQDQ